MRVIGPHPEHSEIELDPAKAYRRGQILDAMLRAGLPEMKRGIYRGTFAEFARMDEARMLMIARRIDQA